ncbi:MAG TPA: hypothetical protein VK151_09340 [Fluviicola sp.]|nr:hypothetical protein [Fluviicola sp.]
MKRALLLLVVALIAADMAWGQGCSQCRMMSEQSSELGEDAFTSNINFGILYLMAVPYLLILFLFRKRIISFFKGLRKG